MQHKVNVLFQIGDKIIKGVIMDVRMETEYVVSSMGGKPTPAFNRYSLDVVEIDTIDSDGGPLEVPEEWTDGYAGF